MIIDGIQLGEGSSIVNMTVSSGPTFPSNATVGEFFYQIGHGLFVYNGSGWLEATNTAVDATSLLGTLPAANFPALSGDVSNTAGSLSVSLSNSGVTAGTYNSVTVDAKGRVTSGINPTTLSGYGITDGATQTYVDSAVAGLTWKNSVKVATTANITLSGAQTIDGISVVAGDRVLVKNQTTASQNGIYVAASGTWTRATDFDSLTPVDEINGAAVWVKSGSTQGNTGWVENAAVITLDSSNITFAQFNGSSSVVAGSGLTLTGNTLTVNLGAGIASLPTNEVGIDVYSGGGLMTTADGTATSTATGAQLSLTKTGVGAGTYSTVTVDAYGRVTSALAAASTNGMPYDLSFSVFGKPAANEVIFRFLTARPFTIPGSFAGSYGKAQTASTGSMSFDIRKNGASIALANIGAGSTNFSFSTQAAVSFVAGDLLSVHALGGPDATLSDIDFTFLATING